ncbi:MAG: hypothetical protein R2820_00510 [Cyclobacteriaceae bacterium]|nr:hypothetical protein [Cyclobacteriaceae bacterium]
MTFPGSHTFLFVFLLLTGVISTIPTVANALEAKDTTRHTVLVISPRLNSTGHFPFTGALINHHLNADINIFYDRHPVGFFLFKSQDLQEKSIVNYLQPGVFATVKLSPQLKVRGFFGYLLSQAEGFRDEDSDYYTAATVYWEIAPGFRLENTALFYDLTLGTKLAERLLLSYQVKKYKLDLYVWHRMVLDEGDHSTSAMLAFTFPQIKLSDKTTLLFTSSYQSYLTTNRPGFALKNGFLFSLAMPITVLE